MRPCGLPSCCAICSLPACLQSLRVGERGASFAGFGEEGDDSGELSAECCRTALLCHTLIDHHGLKGSRACSVPGACWLSHIPARNRSAGVLQPVGVTLSAPGAPACLPQPPLLSSIYSTAATTDDGDFFQELRDMLGVEQQEGAGPGRWAAGGGGSRRRKLSEVS